MHPFEATWRSNVNFLVKCLVKFLVKILVKLNNRNNSIHCNKGARARRALPFIASVLAVVPVVLLDQTLDLKFDPNLDLTIAG